MPLSNINGKLGINRAAHFLRRTCFGGSIQEIDRFAKLTAKEAVAELFNNDLPQPNEPLDPLTGKSWVSEKPETKFLQLKRLLKSWHISVMTTGDAPKEKQLAAIFRERLVLFFHTHFTTQSGKSNNSIFLHHQLSLFRYYAFDKEDNEIPTEKKDDPPKIVKRNFKELTKKICVDNAMLAFLDGGLNVKGNPNENYARELLELYTIGRGMEGKNPKPEFDGDYFLYTEEDVQAAAKVLSGFIHDRAYKTIDPDTKLLRGKTRGGGNFATQHASGEKVFSKRLGNQKVVPNKDLEKFGRPTTDSALDEVSQLIDLIYNQEETAKHICRKVYRFFVYHEITDELNNTVIKEMAKTFTENDFKLQPVLEQLFTSKHFYEGTKGYQNDSFGALIKSPLDLIVGFHRNFNMTTPSPTADIETYYKYFRTMLSQSARQGMAHYDPAEVAGHPAYHQFPNYNRNWISTNYLTNRYFFINERVSSKRKNELGKLDVFDYIKKNIPNEKAGNARTLVATLAQYFLPVSSQASFDDKAKSELSKERMNYFLNAFLYSPKIDADPEKSWAFRWKTGVDDEVVANQLANLFNAMFQSPEYQLM